MAKNRYLKSPDGKLAGSAPAPATAPSPVSDVVAKATALLERNPKPKCDTGDAYFAFKNRPSSSSHEWAQGAPFSLVNATVTDDYAILTDYTREEETLENRGRERLALLKIETADMYLRGEEVQRDSKAPGLWTSVVRFPAYLSSDGSCVATRTTRGDFGSSQERGIVNSSREFIADPQSFSDVFKERLGEPGCPLHDEMEGYPEDWQISTVTDRDHGVMGLHLKVTGSPVEEEFSVLENPDSAWDSRFD